MTSHNENSKNQKGDITLAAHHCKVSVLLSKTIFLILLF